MKVFKKWSEEDAISFVVFLGKEARDSSRRMREFYSKYNNNGDLDSLKQYTVQCGAAMQLRSIYTIAKYHFGLDTFNRKHAIKKPF
jgi:hypothetical protein